MNLIPGTARVTSALARRSAAVLAALLLCACGAKVTPGTTSPGTPGTTPEDAYRFSSAVLSRGFCYGTCPGYTVTITGEGLVVWEGRGFVDALGKRTTAIDAEAAREFLAGLDQPDTLQHSRECTQEVTDLPGYSLTFRHGERETVLKSYACEDKDVAALLSSADQLAGTDAWIGDGPHAYEDMPPERPKPTGIPGAELALRNSGCAYDACPEYEIRIAGDGSITWSGQHRVAARGEVRREIAPRKAQDLIRRVKDAGLLSAALHCDASPDVPDWTLSLKLDQSSNSVMLSTCDVPRLHELAREIERAAGAESLIGSSPG